MNNMTQRTCTCSILPTLLITATTLLGAASPLAFEPTACRSGNGGRNLPDVNRRSILPPWCHQEMGSVACTTLGSALLFFSLITATISPPPVFAAPIDMTFENGKVLLSDPLRFFDEQPELRNPQFLGSGGGGAVYAYSRDHSSSRAIVKVSWVRSAGSVEKECEVFQVLERRHVEGVEKCLGQRSYPPDSRRTMILMEPVVEESVASVTEIDKKLQPHSVKCIVRTAVQMLAAGVVTTDVQPLISTSTGEVVFIDMTEAKILPIENGESISFLDEALASSFCSEMIVLIPDEFGDLASRTLLEELQKMESRGDKLPRSELLGLMQGQATFLSKEASDYIEARI